MWYWPMNLDSDVPRTFRGEGRKENFQPLYCDADLTQMQPLHYGADLWTTEMHYEEKDLYCDFDNLCTYCVFRKWECLNWVAIHLAGVI